MSNILQYMPFETIVDSSFWHTVSKKKLETFKIEEGPFEVHGEFSNNQSDNISPRVFLDTSSLSAEISKKNNFFSVVGELYCFNSRDRFIKTNKQELLDDFGKKYLLPCLEDGEFLKDPSLLAKFLLVTHCDIKVSKFSFWFAYPAFFLNEKQPTLEKVSKIDQEFSDDQLNDLAQRYNAWNDGFDLNQVFFILKKTGSGLEVGSLETWDSTNQDSMIGFCDSSTSEKYPGWPLRNMLICLATRIPEKSAKIKVLCLRERYKSSKLDCSHSIILEIGLEKLEDISSIRFVGWEKYKQKLMPRQADLSSSMDPVKLSEAAVDLNLKLMHWRLLPEIDLVKIKETKCLLLGAGTLGCNVARQLLGWGVNHITFVDNSRVSYSNPVRQTLFTFNDSKEKKFKAEAAAEHLKEIFPSCTPSGHVLEIPMPGHPVHNAALDEEANKNLLKECQQNCEKLKELIKEHDAIFLLLDTRESRWLPSLLGIIHKKLIFNGALGFDSYLAMRHGYPRTEGSSPSEIPEGTVVTDEKEGRSGHNLGCYFCNDVVGPANSTIDRSLDQQCTVSRPGTSMIAASLLTELFVSVIQHPLGGGAPVRPKNSILGQIPHQIRGFIPSYQIVTPESEAFRNCPACSQSVLDEYKKENFDFLLKVFENSKHLEDICGLTKLQEDSLDQDIMVVEDSD